MPKILFLKSKQNVIKSKKGTTQINWKYTRETSSYKGKIFMPKVLIHLVISNSYINSSTSYETVLTLLKSPTIKLNIMRNRVHIAHM